MFYYLKAYLYEKKVKINVGKVAACAVISVVGYGFSYLFIGDGLMLVKLVRLLAGNACSLAGVLLVYGIGNLFGCHAGRSALWSKLRQDSFGIYLFHQQSIYPFIMILNERVYPIIQVFFSFFIVIVIAGTMTVVLRKWKITGFIFAL